MLSDQWVLTSADCVCNVVNTNNLVVRNGACNTAENTLGHSVMDIKCYSKHTSTVLNTNLALVKINTSSMLTEQRHAIHPVCPTKKLKSNIKIGEQVMFLGWGNIVGSDFNNASLKLSNVTIANKKECKTSFVNEGATTIRGSAIFCTYGDTIAYCNGNIGAGVVAVDGRGYLLLKGVISRSTKDCGQPGYNIVHSRLDLKKVKKWIKKIIKP